MAAVDLSQLPKPKIIEVVDFETILSEIKATMIAAFPSDMQAAITAALALESEPLNVLAQTVAYREMMLCQKINEGAAACTLSHAVDTDLDNLAGNLGVARLVVSEATNAAPAVMESDAKLRMRAQSAFEGLSTAGPTTAYEFFASSASGKVIDAKAISPSPTVVVVSLLSAEGDGTASSDLIKTVDAMLSAKTRRPVGDRLTVQSAEIVKYRVSALLYLYPGPESEPILTAAAESFEKYRAEQGRIGQNVARSAITAALHVTGVQRVELLEPVQDIVIDDTQAARCENVVIDVGGTDE